MADPSANGASTATFQDDPEAQFTIRGFWRSIRKNWWLLAAVTVAVTLGTTFYTLGQKKIFEATSTLQIDPKPPSPLGKEVQSVVDFGANYWENKEHFQTQVTVIQSMRVATAVVRDLRLNEDAAYLQNAPPGKSVAPGSVSVEAAAEVLRTRLKVEPIKDSRLIVLSIEDADPTRAQMILSTVVDTYVQQNLDLLLSSTTSAVDWLRGQLGKLKTELETNEMALHDYKLKKNILSVSIDDQSNMLRAEMQQLTAALTAARAKREELAGRQTQLAKISAEDPSNLPATELLENALLSSFRHDYVAATKQRAALLAEGKGEEHPKARAATEHVTETRTALQAEVRNIQGSLERAISAADQQIGGLSGLYEGAKKRALELNLLEIEYNRLARSKSNTEKLYGLVQERTGESDLTRMLRFNNITVVDQARAKKEPIRPRVPINLALGILAGLVLGVGGAIGKDALDRSIKTPEDLERELGLTFLGLLPEIDETAKPTYGRKRRRRQREVLDAAGHPPELLVHVRPTSGIAEAARAVRTNIMFMAPDRPHRALLVTSAGPSEGKTTVACCIAIAMAQAGQRVLLVDCDMRRPRIHRLFGVGNQAGVTTALLAPGSVHSAIHDTVVPNLSVLPTGPLPPNPAELLHSESFVTLLRVLRESFDRVVIDSPPVVPVTDGAVLSTLVDGTVLVIRAFRTSKEIARQGVRLLRDVGATLVGGVLNSVDLGRQEYGYYHYYYYKRDGYAQEQAPHSSPSPPEQPPSAPPN